MSTMRGRAVIAVAILGLGAGLIGHRQMGLNKGSAKLAAARAELDKTIRERGAVEERVETLRNQISEERAQRDSALAAVALAGRQAIEEQSAARWSQPPASPPDWNPASPYVWLRKDAVARLGVRPFNEDRSLSDQICAVLDISAAARAEIEPVLQRGFAEWRASEVALAERSGEPLLMRSNKGRPVTVRVPPQPELASRLRGEMDAVLKNQLGEQRAELFKRFAESSIDTMLGPAKPVGGEARARVYSVQRDGEMFRIGFDIYGSSTLTVSPDWRFVIPENLHPLFEGALEQR
jgi:hypothetical protein